MVVGTPLAIEFGPVLGGVPGSLYRRYYNVGRLVGKASRGRKFE